MRNPRMTWPRISSRWNPDTGAESEGDNESESGSKWGEVFSKLSPWNPDVGADALIFLTIEKNMPVPPPSL